MSYTPYNWQSGEIITADKLNGMEQGISSAVATAEDIEATVEAWVGSPLQAATKAAMTDTSKIYVYTGSETGMTAGNWYYYDGSDWTDGGVYNSVAVQTDPTLSLPDVAADAAAVGDIKNGLQGFNAFNFLDLYEKTSATHLGISYQWSGGACKVVGTKTSSSDSRRNIYSSTTELPAGLHAGDTIYYVYSSDHVNLEIRYNIEGQTSTTQLVLTKTSGSVVIPTTAVGMLIRFLVNENNIAINETVRPLITYNLPNEQIIPYIASQIGPMVRVGRQQVIDVDDISENVVFYATQSNNANLPTAGNGMLRTVMQTNNYGFQEFFDNSRNIYSWRTHGSSGWQEWHSKAFGSNFYYLSGVSRQDLLYSNLNLDSVHQDIAAYNGKLFSLRQYNNNSQIRIYDLSDNSYSDYPATYGHGNGLVFGKEVADGSDYPLLYISGWDDDTVYVLKFTGTSFVVVNTIALPVSGYTTCAVDDLNSIMYIFSLDVYPRISKPYLFTVWKYDTDTIIHQQYTEPFETMQGIDFSDGTLTVASGYNTAASGKYIRTYDTAGNKTGEYFGHPFTGTIEPEGVTIDPVTKKMYISSTSNAYEVVRV